MTNPAFLAFGKNVRAARLAIGWTQEQLGSRLGVARQTVASWESGSVWPSPLHIEGLRRELGLDATAEPPSTLDDVPAFAVPLMSRETARGMRLAALRMAELAAAMLREAEAVEAAELALDNGTEDETTPMFQREAAAEATPPAPAATSSAGRPRRRPK